MTHIVADGIVLGLIQGVESEDALKERVLASGVVFSRIRLHILNPSCSYAGLRKNIFSTLSGRSPDIRRMWRTELW